MPSSYVIGDHYESFIRNQVKSGRYASASEVIREALRTLEYREQIRQTKLAALRSDIEKGLASGPGIPAEEVFDRLEAKYQRMADDSRTA